MQREVKGWGESSSRQNSKALKKWFTLRATEDRKTNIAISWSNKDKNSPEIAFAHTHMPRDNVTVKYSVFAGVEQDEGLKTATGLFRVRT